MMRKIKKKNYINKLFKKKKKIIKKKIKILLKKKKKNFKAKFNN